MAPSRALLAGLAAAVSLAGGVANAGPLSACVWSKLPAAEQAKTLAAYRQNMAAGATVLDRLGGKLKAATKACAKRGDVPPDWVSTIAGSEAVQTTMAAALQAEKRLDRPRLDAAWAAAPANVLACFRATGRLAFFPNGTGCADPIAAAWLLKRLGLDRSQQPAAQQAIYYFNAKAIGEWGDQLVARLPPKPKR
ncbi:hypothetical protein [Phenylobacterium sp.]|jgi:hypothetical protein|uniref:hypothetical protein n=1 Tax=Phenylobacterium sp. TaxID=1871053 RepID=UPI002F3FD878